MILYADNTQPVHDFAAQHADDKMAIFQFAIQHYEKRHGPLGGDRETVMYDFLANYDPPEGLDAGAASSIFGDHLNNEVRFNTSYDDGSFSINVRKDFVPKAQELSDRAGYIANPWGEFGSNWAYIPMKVMRNHNSLRFADF